MNLQNIPSGEHSIRLMFTATPGYTMLGSDYSAQEPRLLANYSKDKYFIEQLAQGKDPYATVATGVYHNNYEDNLETHADGSYYPEGKKRRKSIKTLLLGILYGMGTPAIAERLGVSSEEANKILNDFFKGFPGIKKWMDDTEAFAKENGYVEDFIGRRRHLPDINLPKYSIIAPKVSTFNPLLGSSGIIGDNEDLIIKYSQLLSKCKYNKDIEKVKELAKADDVTIRNNGGFIARAERQCVNARIQGGAASMTKRAMGLIHNDPEMNRMGFRLLIAVHDELIGECPMEYAEQCRKRLGELMCQAALPEVVVKMKCDAVLFPSWYYDEYSADVLKFYNAKLSEGISEVEAYDLTSKNFEELSKEQLDGMLAS